jgi:hypothetical protein
MSKLFLVFNHRFSDTQERDAFLSLGVREIVTLPSYLQDAWSNLPADLPCLQSVLAPLKEWLLKHAQKEDYVLIQGDFGACYLMVNFCLENQFIPIYSTTRREAKEEHGPEGSVTITHVFQHQIFRRYGR